jgi:hypothetical protein
VKSIIEDQDQDQKIDVIKSTIEERKITIVIEISIIEEINQDQKINIGIIDEI